VGTEGNGEITPGIGIVPYGNDAISVQGNVQPYSDSDSACGKPCNRSASIEGDSILADENIVSASQPNSITNPNWTGKGISRGQVDVSTYQNRPTDMMASEGIDSVPNRDHAFGSIEIGPCAGGQGLGVAYRDGAIGNVVRVTNGHRSDGINCDRRV